jgi:peptidylprolyl isomerase
MTLRILVMLTLTAAAAAVAFAQAPIPAPPDVASPPSDATKTASGLATKVLKAGTGKDHPAKDDLVMVQYTGWTTDGKMFDSSVARNQPATFGVSKVIPGFSEGLQLMVTGEKRRMWIPEPLAYKGQPGRPKGMLVFDVELIDLPNRAPSDVKEPPADAKKTPSGIAYKVLRQGTGGRHPKASSKVTVHYTGWTTDGKMFDSSVVRGEPTTFPLSGVIAGWTEGLQLMYEGEKTRFWIPEKLAYGGKQPPYGMLVFDVELLKIE